jgi:hypothetical protein
MILASSLSSLYKPAEPALPLEVVFGICLPVIGCSIRYISGDGPALLEDLAEAGLIWRPDDRTEPSLRLFLPLLILTEIQGNAPKWIVSEYAVIQFTTVRNGSADHIRGLQTTRPSDFPSQW